MGVEHSGQYCSLGHEIGGLEGRPCLLLRDLPLDLPGGWQQTPGLPRDRWPQLPLGARTEFRMSSLAPCGQVSDISFPWLMVELVNLDILPLPGLHVVSDFCDSVPEPDFQDLLVALHGRDGALGVAKEEILLGSLLNPGKI